jgi:steroid 5-alpha reductase family enzyme
MMLHILFQTALLILGYVTLWFIVSLIKKRNDVADIAWGLGFIVICLFLFATQPPTPISALVYGLVTLWGLRLAIHIGRRSAGKAEDFRYKNWREEWGDSFLIRSYLQVYILQGFFMLIIALPILVVGTASPQSCLWLDGSFAPYIGTFTVIGGVLWVIGFAFEAIGDYQLSVFIKNKRDKNDIMQTGLWRYTRHPNYFGEVLLWWGIFIITLPLQHGFWGIISPLTITFLLLYVSGIPMLEAKYKGNAAFEDYKRRTSAFFPMPPKMG